MYSISSPEFKKQSNEKKCVKSLQTCLINPPRSYLQNEIMSPTLTTKLLDMTWFVSRVGNSALQFILIFYFYPSSPFPGLSQETGGGRGPSPVTGTTNHLGLSHDQGGMMV